MAIKIDLNKAFDSLEWDFIKNCLTHFDFPPLWIKMIMTCICTTSTTISINGSLSDEFYPSRGIRQGDPISPYIFILCMEYLSFLIEQKCNLGEWKPLKASRNGPFFSHILFADDVLLFGKAKISTTLAMKEVLDNFCSCSGQSINTQNPKILFSPNVTEDFSNTI
ncbi:hypothetical protein SLA2020_198880 [Shorea laevis]